MPKPKLHKDNVTTIQVENETRDFLRKLVVHAKEKHYEDLFTNQIIPILQKEAHSPDPVKIGEWLLKRKEKAPTPPA